MPEGIRCPMELSTYFRINASETPEEFVKELVRGLDDDSSKAEIKKFTARIITVVDGLKLLLDANGFLRDVIN